MVEENNSVFNTVVDVLDSRGVMKKQYALNLSKWTSKDFKGFKDGDKVLEGYTCQIGVNKFGTNPKSSYINIDPSDNELRKAILSMYDSYDTIVA